SAVRQQVLPDFKKSHAARHNEHYDFVFDEETEDTAGWKLDDQGHVIIDTTCTTDPKELDAHRWAVRIKGSWDIATGKFLENSLTRIPPRPNQTLQPTAGRRVVSLFGMKQLPILVKLALASGG